MHTSTISAFRTKDLTLAAAFAGIIILMAFTPLGFIPLPFIKMTIIHIPVVLGAILLGPKYGAFLGFLFGLTSLINNTITPAVTSFTFSPFIDVPGTGHGSFWAIIVCFLPRILVGIIPYYVYRAICRGWTDKKGGRELALACGGLSGALTNTIGVMGLIYLLFRGAYAAARGVEESAVAGIVLGIVGFNGVIEAIGAAILVLAIGKVLLRLRKDRE